MGTYEQDTNEFNGEEPISWTVIDIQDGKALLLADCILEVMQFCSSRSSTWDESSLRGWLNRTFKREHFTSSEQKNIVNSVATADPYSKNTTVNQGTATQDDIFIVSYAEILKYGCASCDKSAYANNARGVRPAMWITIDK